MDQACPLPPAVTGPAGRAALKALIRDRSTLASLQALHRELGDVFRFSLPGFRPTVLVGPEANHFVLVEARDSLSWRPVGDPVTRLLRHGLLVEDGRSHDQLRRLMTPSLRRSKIGDYLPAMWQRTEQVAARWRDGTTVDMLVEMRRVALLILMDTLFGIDFAPDLDRLWPAILRVLDYISPGLWLVLPGAPRPGYGRALHVMDEYLYALIARRRRETRDPQSDDLLARLLATPGMSDRLVRDQLLTLLIAGHDTSTALLAWTLYALGSHPEAMRHAREEVDAVLGDRSPGEGGLAGLNYVDQVINETLRLYPPIHLGNRRVVRDVEYRGYRIPAGSRLLYSIYLTHRNEAHWSCPAQFDPERFDRRAMRDIPPYAFVPFGGGPRNCLGAAFARAEATVVLAYVLRHFDLQPAWGKIRQHMGATLEPRPGLPMRVRTRS